MLSEIGIDCIRSVQYSGRNGTADLVCDADLHIEVKRTERLAPYAFLEQAMRDARTGTTPIVVMRSSYKPWLIMMRVQDAPAFASELLAARSKRDAAEADE